MFGAVSQLNCADLEFVPLEKCKYGLLVNESSPTGIYTNIPDIASSLKTCSESLMRKQGKNPASQSLSHHDVFADVLSTLFSSGVSAIRNQGTTMESFMQASSDSQSPHSDRIVKHVWDWIVAEELCDYDYQNHHLLTSAYPRSGLNVPHPLSA